MASSAVTSDFASRDEAKEQRKLTEARQSGNAAAEIDEATGKMINPHNPQFIVQAPWYLNQTAPSLKHHNAWNLKKAGTNDWFKRGHKGDVKTKFVKGACENCGATTHKKRDCTERPRQLGAKFTGKDLCPDEFVEHLDLDWAGKHDRWNGFVADDFAKVTEAYHAADELRKEEKEREHEKKKMLRNGELRKKRRKKKKERKAAERKKQLAEGSGDTDSDTGGDTDTDTDTDSDSDSDGSGEEGDLGERIKDFDKEGVVGTRDNRVRTTTRNLRIREDTARYLINLDVNSAYYDPKARAMRDNPMKNLPEKDQGVYRGDNANRGKGETAELRKLEIFCWDAYKNGTDIHEQSMPTQAALMFAKVKGRKETLMEQREQELKKKYNSGDNAPLPPELTNAQNDQYVEYRLDGSIAVGRERAMMKSKYEEDIHPNGHSSIWGSYYCTTKERWGYSCCRETQRNAYCLRKSKTGPDVPAKADAGAGAAEVARVPLPVAPAVPQHEGPAAPPPAASSLEADAESTPVPRVPKDFVGMSPLSRKPVAGAAAAAGEEQPPKRGGVDLEALAHANEAYREKRLLQDDDDGEADVEDQGGQRRSMLAALKREKKRKREEEKAEKAKRQATAASSNAVAFGAHELENVTDLDAKKLKRAVKEAKRAQREAAKGDTGDADRKYNSGISELNKTTELTAEEYEAHRLTRKRNFDPMDNINFDDVD